MVGLDDQRDRHSCMRSGQASMSCSVDSPWGAFSTLFLHDSQPPVGILIASACKGRRYQLQQCLRRHLDRLAVQMLKVTRLVLLVPVSHRHGRMRPCDLTGETVRSAHRFAASNLTDHVEPQVRMRARREERPPVGFACPSCLFA